MKMSKKNIFVTLGFISVFFALAAGGVAMSVNPVCGLFVLPAVGFIAYNVYKAVK